MLEPAFHSIISAGENNFCIHYDSYMGQAKDGDMILNDVGAQWDGGECNDVSRGWPCNGKYSKSSSACCMSVPSIRPNYMFSIIKPGMLMDDVDKTARRYCCEQLKKRSVCCPLTMRLANTCGTAVRTMSATTCTMLSMHSAAFLAPNMVFCVDIGIYAEDLGIGFRVEDNCLVTPTGAENLSASVPRTIEDIEAVMAK